MRAYYVNGEKITEEQAREIEIQNMKILESGDFEQMSKIQFIVVA